MNLNKSVGTFVPSQLTIVISHTATGSSFVLGGYGADSVVSLERGDPKWESTIGVDGMHERIHRLDTTYRATVSLLQTSMSNDFLSAVAKYDERDLRGGGLFTCTITDKSGRSYVYSDQAYVIEPSSYEFSQTSNTRDWVIVMPYTDAYLGGNDRLSTEHQAVLEKLGVFIDESWVQF